MFSNAGQIALTLLAAAPTALACLGYTGGLPKATGNVALTAPIYVKAGQVYDGGWRKFDRNPSSCNGQSEGGEKDTAFVVERGGTLRNVIIGKTVGEGVYCKGGGCNLEFIWFEDVCEDAISIKDDRPGDVTNIIGGGAYHASDKVIQHNGCGRVNVSVLRSTPHGTSNSNILGRSSTSMPRTTKCAREVYVEGVTARKGGEVVGITKANGDKATLVNVCTDAKTPCQNYSGPGAKDGAC
uniref:Pectate lyase n=1 Tax=Podospora anserina (strain S / ATCC MYA-4624 / DSM 980 / FGSC 10383) TaxID=515849 RepID=A0A090CHY9_PODAN|nr:Putative Polysaccharide Lyase Family 3 [Podospora anserina S mat+]